jgi:aconitate hydratase
MGELCEIPMPEKLRMQPALIVEPPDSEEARKVELIRGPNIKPIELRGELPEKVRGTVLIKLEDNISTDIIMPAGVYLSLRSNVPEYAKHVFEPVDPDFYRKAKEKNGGFVIAGENYGQGSSREHAALCPSYLGVMGVIAKSFARIHLANLINFGIIPLTFKNSDDYDRIAPDDELQLDTAALDSSDLVVKNLTKGIEIPVQHSMTPSEVMRIKAGGTLAYISRHNL